MRCDAEVTNTTPKKLLVVLKLDKVVLTVTIRSDVKILVDFI